MNKTVIRAEVVAHSLNPQGDELVSLRITFPRIILAEVNTHRMLSKNTSSSRAIPFKKMVESVQNDPFIPIAWQKPHSGMQGTEYYDHTLTEEVGGLDYTNLPRRWLRARDTAVSMAKIMADERGNMPVTKQLANRLLEPFMWTTMLITGSKEGWDNFFELRCPKYSVGNEVYRSKKDAINQEEDEINSRILSGFSKLEWLTMNKGQAEIHMQALAEAMWDAMGESIPVELKAGEWHMPYVDNIEFTPHISKKTGNLVSYRRYVKLKISTARCARLSYQTVGDSPKIDYEADINLHDRLFTSKHFSPFEHCARAMTLYEYETFIKGVGTAYIGEEGIRFEDPSTHGWCNNIKGFIPYRYMIENNLNM